MKLKKFLILYIIISGGISFSISTAQSAYDALVMAGNWFAEGNYPSAIVEAKRAVFFDDSIRIPGYLLLSDCYNQMELYDEALKYLSLAVELENNDSIRAELIFKKINLYLRTRQPAYAFIALSQLTDNSLPYFSKKKDFYTALAYFQINDFIQAERYTDHLLQETSRYDSCYISTLFLKAFKNSAKSPVLPAVSSAVLPGSGQLMKGYYRDAANAFLLNTCIATITYFTFIRLNPLDAILAMFPFVQRYYWSNIFNAGELSRLKQERVNNELYNELLDYIDQVLNQ